MCMYIHVCTTCMHLPVEARRWALDLLNLELTGGCEPPNGYELKLDSLKSVAILSC